MIVGRVNQNYEIVIPIILPDILGTEYHEYHALIDTGMDHYLMLPRSIVEEMGFPMTGSNKLTLGDGQEHEFDQCLAAILWDDIATGVPALVSETECLVGARLLAGSHLTATMVPGGTVTVNRLATF